MSRVRELLSLQKPPALQCASPELLPLQCKVDFDFVVELTVPGIWQSESITGSSSSVHCNPQAA